MMENMNLVIGDKEIVELEQTLTENLNEYKDLIDRMNSIQPKLCLTAILKRNICLILGILESMKQDDCLIDYKIGWAKNTLKIFCINHNKKVGIMTVKLVRHKLIHNNNDNIQFYIIGVV